MATLPHYNQNYTIINDAHCVNDSCPNAVQAPAHIASNMVDGIHQRVQGMLAHSRLVRKTDGIELLERHNIYATGRRLGSGAFSEVKEVTTNDGKVYALKNLKAELLENPHEFQTAATELAYEAHMMGSFDHPNILKIRGWARNGISSFEDGGHDSFFLLLDRLDETLDRRIQAWNQTAPYLDQYHSNLRYMEKIQCLIEIASALDYVHEHGVIFRDLKPNNIGLLNGRVQLFDFGLSRELPTLDTQTPFQMSGKVGTIRYMAPEVVLHHPYNVSADVFSWSMVAYEVLTGEKPFCGWTPDLHAEYVCQRGMRPDINDKVPLDMQILLQHCWQSCASQRPCLKEIIAQLQLFREKYRLLVEEQQLHRDTFFQPHQPLQYQVQVEQPVQPIEGGHDFFIDLNDMQGFQQQGLSGFVPSPRKRDNRTGGSVCTLETESMSAASFGW